MSNQILRGLYNLINQGPCHRTDHVRLIILSQRGKEHLEKWMEFIKVKVYYGYRKGKRSKTNYTNNGDGRKILVREGFSQ